MQLILEMGIPTNAVQIQDTLFILFIYLLFIYWFIRLFIDLFKGLGVVGAFVAICNRLFLSFYFVSVRALCSLN